MAGENDPVRLAILAKIAAWTTVLDSYDAAVSGDGPANGDVTIALTGVTATGSVGRLQPSIDLPVGVFRDKSLKDAILIYLGAVRRKQTNKEIAAGLQAGGFPTTSGNFESTVATALFRLKNDGVLLRFPDGWDLASSYPDSLRSRLEKDVKPRKGSSAKPKKGKKRRASAARAATKTATTAKPRKRSTAADGPSIDQQILKILMTDGPNSPAGLVARLERPVNVVGLALGRLAKLGKAQKLANGNYSAVKLEPALRAV